MDELDLFRDFRRDVAAPTADAERRATARLTSAIEGRHWPGTRILRPIRKRPARAALAFAAVAVASAIALFVSTPWKTAPAFLERAEAALTPPAGTVLHMKWLLTRTWPARSCTVTRGPNEVWVDQTPPNRFRELAKDIPDISDPVCSGGTPGEVGGTIDPPEELLFVPPNTLTSPGLPNFRFGPPDFVEALRTAISDGRAHEEGKTRLDGRTVVRIRVDPPADCPVPGCEKWEPDYWYVDPETYYPVQKESSNGVNVGPDGKPVQFQAVVRFLTYEYLPGTAANRALADIWAQHPNALGP